MKSFAAVAIIERMLGKVVDENKHEGEIIVRMNCHCGGIRNVQIDVDEKKTASFIFSGNEPELLADKK